MTIRTGFAVALVSLSLLSANAARAFDPVAGVIVGATIGAIIADDVHHRSYYYPRGYSCTPGYDCPPGYGSAPVAPPVYYPQPVYVGPYYWHGGYRHHNRGWDGRRGGHHRR